MSNNCARISARGISPPPSKKLRTGSNAAQSTAKPNTYFGGNLSELPRFDGYRALNNWQKQIRLFRFVSSDPNQLSCSLSTASLLDATIEYIALSYRWGAPPSSQSEMRGLTIDGRLVLLRPSLHTFLQTLASKHPTSMFWVDVLCINQHDNDERASQVSIMGDIYASAARVLLWLGEVDADVEYVFAQVTAYQNGKQITQPHAFLDSVLCLFCRPYWTRMWVVQEFTMAKTVDIVCGDLELPWNRLNDAVKACGPTPEDDRGWDIYRRFQRFRDRIPEQKTFLLDLMQACRHSRCSDRRDMVYALRGLASDGDFIRIDYKRNTMHLIFQFLENVMCSERHQDTPGLCWLKDRREFVTGLEIGDTQTSGHVLQANHSLSLLSYLRPLLRVSKEEFVECLRDKYRSTTFVSKTSFYGQIAESKNLPLSPRVSATPEVWHSLQSACFEVALISIARNDRFNGLWSYRENNDDWERRVFRGSSVIKKGEVVMLHDIYLVFSEEDNQPRAIIEIDNDENGTMLGRKISMLSPEDIHYLSEVLRRCVRRCTWYENLDLGLPHRLDAEVYVHISVTLFFILTFATSEPWVSWALLREFYKEPEGIELLAPCSCMHAPNHQLHWGLLRGYPAQFAGDLFAFEKTSHEEAVDRQKYHEAINVSLKQKNDYYHIKQLEWVKFNQYKTLPEWYKYLHNEDWDEHKILNTLPVFKVGDQWTFTNSTSWPDPHLSKGLEDFDSEYRSCYAKPQLILVKNIRGIWLGIRSEKREQPTLNHFLNLDAIIKTDSGRLEWVRAVYDLGLTDDPTRVGWHKVIAAPEKWNYLCRKERAHSGTERKVINTALYVEKGEFSTSARNVQLSEDGFTLEADLPLGNGSYCKAALDLGKRIVLFQHRLRYTFLVVPEQNDPAQKPRATSVWQFMHESRFGRHVDNEEMPQKSLEESD